MISASQLAGLCKSIYAGDTAAFKRIVDTGKVCYGITVVDGQKVIAFRGSKTLLDWFHDFEAIPISVPNVGTVHAGFWDGVEEAWDLANLSPGETVAIACHSLGCAHGALFARLCLLHGVRVSQLYLFAPPRVGYRDFWSGLAAVTDLKAWHNTSEIVGDPVPLVPISLIGFPWDQTPLSIITVPPGGIDDVEPTDWHHIELYLTGVSEIK